MYDINPMLYGESKIAFIESLINEDRAKNTIKSTENFLIRVQNYEEEMTNDKDLKDYDYDETIAMISYFGIKSSSAESLVVITQYIKDYRLFCSQNGYSRPTMDFNELLKPKNLKEHINSNKESWKYISFNTFKTLVAVADDYTSKAILWLLWNGISTKEIVDIKISDVDTENMTIKGVKYDKEIIDIVYKAYKESSYIYTLSKDGVGIIRNYEMSEYVVKWYCLENGAGVHTKHDRNGAVNQNYMSRKVSEITKYTNIRVTPNSIIRSSILWDMYKNNMHEGFKKSDMAQYVMDKYKYSASIAYKLVGIFLNIYVDKMKEELGE